MTLFTPLKDDENHILADWLELYALMATDHTANLDLIVDAFDISEDTEDDDFGHKDQIIEDTYCLLSDEIKLRLDALGEDVYPFRINKNGESVTYIGANSFGAVSYLVSLIISNSWSRGKLVKPCKLTDSELREGRNIFEIIATIAAIGYTRGPGFLLGSNRRGAIGLLERIQHICDVVKEGEARVTPHPAAPPNANDDKVDIISVAREQDGPPHRCHHFGQSAAGENFRQKSIKTEVDRFLEIWYQIRPANTAPLMFIPAVLDRKELTYETPRLGHLAHRLRTPKYAQDGVELLKSEASLLHYVDDIDEPNRWLASYLSRIHHTGAGASA